MAVIKQYLYALIGGFLAFMGVYLYAKGRSDQKDKLSRDNLDAMRKSKDVRDEIQDDPYFVDRARQWTRQK